MKKYLLLALHGTPLLLVATFSFGLWLALQAGFLGIPLGFLLLSWFFKYCFVLLDSIIAGEHEPPVLSIEMVNPVSEQRPLVLALLIVAESMGVGYLQVHFGPRAAACIGAVLVWVLPANIAVLGINRHPFLAISPRTLAAFIGALGRDYWLLNAVMLVAAGIVYWLATHAVSTWLLLTTTQWLLLLTFALLGGAIFEHRLDLGIESKTWRERLAERESREHESERRQMLDRAYSKFRVHKPDEGWVHIESWLREHGGPPNASTDTLVDSRVLEYRAVLAAASQWDDVRAADRLANELVGILLAKRANGEALSVVEQRLATNAHYQVAPASQALRIAELALAAGKRALQRQLAGAAQPGAVDRK